MCHQGPIEVDGKRQEYNKNRNQDDAGWPSSSFGEVVELHPAEDGDLKQKQYKAEKSGKRPSSFNIPEQLHQDELLHIQCITSREAKI